MSNKAKSNTITTETPGQNKIAIALSAVAAVGYYAYSFKSNGYYQHDEIGHLLNMYEFWENPSSILGNWPKTGYKLVYAVPALLGSKFLVILNCLLAALAAFLAFKVTEFFDKRYALLALVLTAVQPMWIELAFRNYADSFSGLILISALFFHYRRNFLIAGLLFSFSTLVRQEFFLIAIPYGIYLLTQRKWLAAVLMGSFPVLYDVWGAVVHGDPLYLINSARETSDLYSSQFGRHGFFHFWRMSFIVWGAACVVLSILFAGQVVTGTVEKRLSTLFSANPWFLLLPALIYLLIHSLFNWEALALGASPNLRYMNGIGPLMGTMGAIGLSTWEKTRQKGKVLLGLIAVALLFYAIFSTKAHNGVVLTEESDYSLLFMGVLALGLLLIKLGNRQYLIAFSLLALISGIMPLQPKSPSPEDEAIRKLSRWLAKKDPEQLTFFTNHTVVPYFYEKEAGRVPKNMLSLDSTDIANAPLGSFVIIESHYSLRLDFPPPAESIRNQYLQDRNFGNAINQFIQINQGNYAVVQEFVSKDQRFGAIVLEKVK